MSREAGPEKIIDLSSRRTAKKVRRIFQESLESFSCLSGMGPAPVPVGLELEDFTTTQVVAERDANGNLTRFSCESTVLLEYRKRQS
jgi:hypothetical protein